MSTYEIVTTSDPQSRDWTTEPLGEGAANRFATVEEAREMIEQLRRLGDEWAAAVYAVRRLGDDYPL